MRTELDTLKQLVSTIIRQEEQPETLTLLQKEAERLPDAITANTFILSTDNQVHDYIIWQQDLLIKEANLLYKSCKKFPRLISQKGLVVILSVNSLFPPLGDLSQRERGGVYSLLNMEGCPKGREDSEGRSYLPE